MKRTKKKISRRPRRSGPRPAKRAKRRSITAKPGGACRRVDPNGNMKLVVKPIGVAKTIIYRRDGRDYSHQFRNAKLYVTAGGRELIIAKVSVDRSTLQIRG